MANSNEVLELIRDKNLIKRVAVAVMVRATNVNSLPSPTLTQKTWAVEALTNPTREAKRFLAAFIAENRNLSVVQINALTAGDIQSSVNSFYEMFADVDAGV